MKVVLVRTPFINPDYPPDAGLGYLASYIESRGYETEICDINIELYSKSRTSEQNIWSNRNSTPLELEALSDLYRDELDNYANKILNSGPRVVGISVWESSVDFSTALADKIKSYDNNITIILGGPECHLLCSGRDLALEKSVDAVIYGEGEIPFTDILDQIKKTGYLSGCPGCIIKDSDTSVRVMDQGAVVRDLDTLPWPDWKMFSLDKYINKNSFFVVESRGCINKCSYCSMPKMAPNYRYRSPASMFNEIKNLQIQFGKNISVFLCTSGIYANKKHLETFCDIIIKNKLVFDWTSFAFPFPHLTKDIIEKIRLAGCSFLNFGIESGSNEVLNAMNRKTTVAIMERILKDCKESGIRCAANFIIGYPGETESQFKETLYFLKKNREYIEVIGSRAACWIDPYSKIHENPGAFGVILSGSPKLDDRWECSETNYEIRERRWEEFGKEAARLGYNMHYDKIKR